MRHIVHIIPALPFGGAEKTIINLVNHSERTRFKYSIIVFSRHNPMAKLLKKGVADLRVVEKKGKLDLGLFERIQGELAGLKPDLVHTHLFGADFYGRLAAKKLGLPVLTTEHNFNYGESWIKNEIKKWLSDKSDWYTAPSEAVKQYMIKRYGVNSAKISVIYPGIELDELSRFEPAKFKEPFKLLFVGRLTKQKGLPVVLQALTKLDKARWMLDVAGEGRDRASLELMCRKMNLTDRVKFLGSVSPMASAYQSADIVLIPSLWEGLGITALEGLASGRLVVASNTGGLPEVVQDGQTGCLAKSGDVADWAQKISWGFENIDQARLLAKAGHAYALNNFGVQKMTHQYEEVYSKF